MGFVITEQTSLESWREEHNQRFFQMETANLEEKVNELWTNARAAELRHQARLSAHAAQQRDADITVLSLRFDGSANNGPYGVTNIMANSVVPATGVSGHTAAAFF